MTRRVGIGIMATAMMRNLLRDGFEVMGYDIAEPAMARLAEAGGIPAASPREIAEEAEILGTSLPTVDAFEQVMAGQAASLQATAAARSSSNAAPCRSRRRNAERLNSARKARSCSIVRSAAQFYHAGVAQGRGGEDTGSVCAVLERLAGIERKG